MPMKKTRTTRTRRATKRKLSPAQTRQRRYASAMRGVRSRAAKAKKGRGLIRVRKAATILRRKLALKG
jgi:hypothetical protein